MLNQIKDILQKNLVVNRHSKFQIEKFIIGKETTPSSQAWQCVRELETRYESLINVNMEIENILDDIEIKKIEIEETSGVQSKKTPFLIRKLERSLQSLHNTHQKLLEKKKNCEEESMIFLEIYKKIENNNDLKKWDNDEAQSEYFENKFGSELNLDFLLGHPVNKELIKSILQLENSSKLKLNLIESINRQKGLLGNGNKT